MNIVKIKKSEMDAINKMVPVPSGPWNDPFTTVEITDEEGNVIDTHYKTCLVASYDTRPKGGVYNLI